MDLPILHERKGELEIESNTGSGRNHSFDFRDSGRGATAGMT
jgi:hypothetical protein